MRNMRIAELLFNRPLMISEGKLNSILHVLGPRLNVDVANLPNEQAQVMSDEQRCRAGYAVVDTTAIIGIYGPLLHRRMASDYPSGGPTTYGEIGQAIDTALQDDGVKSIILDIDSPGGEVNGAFDLADHIYNSRDLKPITAIINEAAYSAAYLLASSASRIILPRTAGVGSVGVIATHMDFSKWEAEEGITVTHVYAGARKADFSQHAPLSTDAFKVLQGMVDDSYRLFVDTVARNRGLDTDAVMATEAGIYIGKKAIAAGLADEVMPVKKAVANQIKGTISSVTATGKKETISMSENKEEQVPAGKAAGGANCGGCACSSCDLPEQECGDCKKKPGMGEHKEMAQKAAADERTSLLALHAAVFGEEAGTKFQAIVSSGITAEQAKTLGVTAQAGEGDVMAAILAALHAASPEGLKPGHMKPAESASIDTAGIYASRQTK